jgi:Cdc6-like AAA superfamily ATPase
MKTNESTVTDILPLTRLGIYNPQRLNDNEVELSFVARQLLFKYIFGYIIDEQSGSIPQHHLIIGQRGMGKSTLLKRMEVELRKSPHCERFIPILFPEEQYNIDRLSKFWLNCLDALADTFEVEHKTEEADTLDEQIKVLTQNRHEGSLSQDAFGLFVKLTTQLNRRAVLLIDNLSLIFDRLSRSEQHQLRAFLTENNAPILIGASAVSIEGTYNRFMMRFRLITSKN